MMKKKIKRTTTQTEQGGFISTEYDSQGRVIIFENECIKETTKYDENGNGIFMSCFHKDSNSEFIAEKEWNEYGFLILEKNNKDGIVYSAKYRSGGLLEEEMDTCNGTSLKVEYNEKGAVIKSTSIVNVGTDYERRTETTKTYDDTKIIRRKTNIKEYDEKELLVEEREHEYEYNEEEIFTRETVIIDGKKVISIFKYNENNDLTEIRTETIFTDTNNDAVINTLNNVSTTTYEYFE